MHHWLKEFASLPEARWGGDEECANRSLGHWESNQEGVPGNLKYGTGCRQLETRGKYKAPVAGNLQPPRDVHQVCEEPSASAYKTNGISLASHQDNASTCSKTDPRPSLTQVSLEICPMTTNHPAYAFNLILDATIATLQRTWAACYVQHHKTTSKDTHDCKPDFHFRYTEELTEQGIICEVS